MSFLNSLWKLFRIFFLFFLLSVFSLFLFHDFHYLSILSVLFFSFVISVMFYDVFIGEKEFSKGNFFFRLDILILILIRIFIENFYATYKFIYRVLKGNYNPGVVRIKTDIKSLTGKVFLANAISSITGTVALWIDGKFIFVHWFDKITFNSIKAGKIIKGNIEKLTKRVFK